jgi:hypothetical protein
MTTPSASGGPQVSSTPARHIKRELTAGGAPRDGSAASLRTSRGSGSDQGLRVCTAQGVVQGTNGTLAGQVSASSEGAAIWFEKVGGVA